MEEKKTIFNYLQNILSSFGICMVTMMGLCKIFGADAKGFSTMFALGDEGLSIATMLQFLMVIVCIEIIRIIFITDRFIKHMNNTLRIALMMIFIVIVMAVTIIVFDWFPTNMLEPWIMFFLCFAFSAGAGVYISSLQERLVNKQMQEGLERLKKEWEEEKNGRKS